MEDYEKSLPPVLLSAQHELDYLTLLSRLWTVGLIKPDPLWFCTLSFKVGEILRNEHMHLRRGDISATHTTILKHVPWTALCKRSWSTLGCGLVMLHLQFWAPAHSTQVFTQSSTASQQGDDHVQSRLVYGGHTWHHFYMYMSCMQKGAEVTSGNTVNICPHSSFTWLHYYTSCFPSSKLTAVSGNAASLPGSESSINLPQEPL